MEFDVRLTRPDGTTYAQSRYPVNGEPFDVWRVRVDLNGRGQSAPLAGTWQLSMALGSAAPCTYGLRVEQGTQVAATPSRTSFDPNYTYSITVSWALLQDAEQGAVFLMRLVMPNGTVASTGDMYISEYTTSGTEFLSLPFCYRSSFTSSDSCQYGAYRVEVLKNGQTIMSIPIDGYKP